MVQLVYDGSFEGLLTAVFETYERKIDDACIVHEKVYQPVLYGDAINIIADDQKALRVWKGLKKKLSIAKCNEVYKTYLSGLPEMETTLLSFIQYIFSSEEVVESDYGHQAVLAVSQIARQVHREKHRMEAFVRFQKTKDDLYFASIEPDYNVLPLIIRHFKDRYADQHWLIFDKKRDYGIQYDKDSGNVSEVQLDFTNAADEEFLPSEIRADDEQAYQILWRKYFNSVNIAARKNKKLHLRHVPLRYWKYLTEKQ